MAGVIIILITLVLLNSSFDADKPQEYSEKPFLSIPRFYAHANLMIGNPFCKWSTETLKVKFSYKFILLAGGGGEPHTHV